MSGSGATSSSASCTVGSFTRSSTNGTVTATITAASAGSCTIGATLDGSSAVTATQAVTVAAAAPTPDTNPTTTPITISNGSGTIPSGGTGTITGVSNVTIGSGSTLNILSSSASGSTLTLPTTSSGGVTLNMGGSEPIIVSSNTSGTTLGVSSITLSGSTTPVNTVIVTSGSATLSTSGSGLLASLPSGGSGGLIVSGSGGATINATVTSSGSTSIGVSSGSVTAPKNCGTRPSLPATPGEGGTSAAWNNYFDQITRYENALLSYALCFVDSASDIVASERAVPSARASAATPATLTLYKGESITYDKNGNVTGTSLVDGGVGATQSLVLPFGMSLDSVPVSIDGTPARLNGANLGSSVVNALAASLGTTLTRASNSSIGGIVTVLADGTTITSVPVGPLQIAPSAVSGLQSNGLAQIVVNGVVVNLAPSLANPAALASKFKSLDAQATETVLANGLIKVTVGGAQYIARPAWTASPSTASSLSADAAGNLILSDGKLQQKLYPAFVDLNKVAAVLTTVSGASSPALAADGTVTFSVGSNMFTLRAGYQLISRPLAHINDLWWVDGGTLYLNYMDGTAQSFSVQ